MKEKSITIRKQNFLHVLETDMEMLQTVKPESIQSRN